MVDANALCLCVGTLCFGGGTLCLGGGTLCFGSGTLCFGGGTLCYKWLTHNAPPLAFTSTIVGTCLTRRDHSHSRLSGSLERAHWSGDSRSWCGILNSYNIHDFLFLGCVRKRRTAQQLFLLRRPRNLWTCGLHWSWLNRTYVLLGLFLLYLWNYFERSYYIETNALCTISWGSQHKRQALGMWCSVPCFILDI